MSRARSRTLQATHALTPDAVRRGIYLDFEGFADGPPAILGVLIDGAFETLVLDPSLEHFGVDLADRYLNVHRVAKRWWKATRTERPRRGGGKGAGRWQFPGRAGYCLVFEKGLGLERPRHLVHGIATRRLRAVRAPLERHGDWSRLTGTVKAKWRKLLDYNETDVRNTASLARQVAGGA